ncbi:MAG: GNAT family N-acetyltransferase [Pararhodobacter sp.]
MRNVSSPVDDPVFGTPLEQGGWVVRLARDDDLGAVLALRGRVFRGGADDTDAHDAASLHLWIGRAGQGPRATLRLRLHEDAESLLSGYAAQHYDLTALAAAGGRVLELGRLCAEGPAMDADLLRLVWAGVARIALRTGTARLIGCTSFHTTEAASLDPALALLRARHLGPDDLRPGRKAPEARGVEAAGVPPRPEAAALMPPLLRVYLAMGGWVSDHLVVDRDLGTCHVFTCVDIAAMPSARRRSLSRLAGEEGA